MTDRASAEGLRDIKARIAALRPWPEGEDLIRALENYAATIEAAALRDHSEGPASAEPEPSQPCDCDPIPHDVREHVATPDRADPDGDKR